MHIHPVFLYFSDPLAEADYGSHHAKSLLIGMDMNFMAINVTFCVLFALSNLLKGAMESVKTLAVSCIPIMIQGLVMRTGIWSEFRMPLATILRLSRTILFFGGVKHWLATSSNTQMVLLKAVIIQSGSLFQIWSALGTPLLFRYHIVVQALVIIYSFTQSCNMQCSEFLQEEGQEYKDVFGMLNDALLVLSGAPIQHNFLTTSSPKLICTHLIWLALLLVGFATPSIVVYHIEMASRISYIKSRAGSRAALRAQQSYSTNWVQKLICFMIGVSALWYLSVLVVSLGLNVIRSHIGI